MSRFYDDGDWDYGRYMLWETAVSNALAGKRGQAALADLEAALLDLPEHRLIHGAVAKEGEVCAIGALVLAKRTEAGEPREKVLADLSRYNDEANDDIADVTACLGAKHGNMAYAMAWQIAYLNDEEVYHLASPEERFQTVLAWVRRARGTTSDSPESLPESQPGGAAAGKDTAAE